MFVDTTNETFPVIMSTDVFKQGDRLCHDKN